MARYKHYDYRQSKLLPVSFAEQILPGSFEQSLCYLIEQELDLSVFERRYSNDEEGRPAYDPAILLKIVLLGCLISATCVGRLKTPPEFSLADRLSIRRTSWRCHQTSIERN